MNMDYCRFQNTLTDLRDCLDHLHNGDLDSVILSDHENDAAYELINVCKEITECWGKIVKENKKEQ